jgi:hypothetical protein
LPNRIFKVHARNKVGDQSSYTVVVAKQLDIGGATDLVVNANYSAAKFPFPISLDHQKAFACQGDFQNSMDVRFLRIAKIEYYNCGSTLHCPAS